MVPIALSKPMTKYNKATTSPPMNWLLDPAPAIRFRSNAESILVPATQPCRNHELPDAGLSFGGFGRRAHEHADAQRTLACARRERPRRRVTKHRDELAPTHIRSQAQETQHCTGSNGYIDRG